MAENAVQNINASSNPSVQNDWANNIRRQKQQRLSKPEQFQYARGVNSNVQYEADKLRMNRLRSETNDFLNQPRFQPGQQATNGRDMKKNDQQTKNLAQNLGRKSPGGVISGGARTAGGPNIGGPIKLNPQDQYRAASQLVKNTSQIMRGQKGSMEAGQGVIKETSQKVTQQLLKWSWLNAVPSFGLTLLYINTHLMAAYLGMTKFFCRLGHEWTPKIGLQPLIGNQSKLAKITEGIIAKSVEIFEIALLLAIDLIIILLVLAIFTIICGILLPGG
jgi:hypothetical protein